MSARWTSSLLSVLRVVVGFLFVAHGTQKLFSFPAPAPGGPLDLTTLSGAAGLIEIVGGTLIIAGLFTRVTAFVLSGEMAVAYFQVHAAKSFWPILNGGELAALYCFTFLFMSAAGGGRWSLDALIGRGRTVRSMMVEAEPQPSGRWAA